MLLEEYISGREFTVGILGNGERLRVFPPMEIIFKDKAHSIYSYEVKRNFRQFVRYECPPNINPDLQKEIESAAETVYRALECRDLARMDFRLTPGGKLYFIAINPLPGLAPEYSDFPMIAGFCGMDYTALIRNILDSALDRYRLGHRV
jgi:D-alanine-D-alanine ligase